MAKGPSPLLGYNNNIRHEGKLYHIQTEDSGVDHPHIITHLFADGGRIIATRKTDYSQHLEAENLEAIVRGLMKEQHKAMAIALRDRLFDEEQQEAEGAQPAEGAPMPTRRMDEDMLERAARARMASSPLWKSVPRASRRQSPLAWPGASRSGEAEGAAQAAAKAKASGEPAPERGAPEGQEDKSPTKMKSIFGSDEVEEMSLDEVILAYIHEDTDGNG